MLWLQWAIFAVSLALQVYVIVLLLRNGAYKDYPFALAYSVVLLFTSIADAAAHAGLVSKGSLKFFYYRNEAARQFLLFVVIVSLIECAMKASPYRTRVRLALAGLAGVALFISLTVHAENNFTLWMTAVTRDLSFGSVVLTLALWSLLISSPKKDRELLMLAGGLGLQFTGEAIGQSLRQISRHRPVILFFGNLLMAVAHLMRLYVWMEAFSRPRVVTQKQKEPGDALEPAPTRANLNESIAG